MPIGKKIRVYDLAREVKQDTKRVMEDLRREGADISVPSNSVSAELADKVRSRYFPKADATPKRAIKVIKAAKKEDVHEAEEAAPAVETVVEVPETTAEEEAVSTEPVETEAAPESKPAVTRKKLVAKPVKVAEPQAA